MACDCTNLNGRFTLDQVSQCDYEQDVSGSCPGINFLSFTFSAVNPSNVIVSASAGSEAAFSASIPHGGDFEIDCSSQTGSMNKVASNEVQCDWGGSVSYFIS